MSSSEVVTTRAYYHDGTISEISSHPTARTSSAAELQSSGVSGVSGDRDIGMVVAGVENMEALKRNFVAANRATARRVSGTIVGSVNDWKKPRQSSKRQTDNKSTDGKTDSK